MAGSRCTTSFIVGTWWTASGTATWRSGCEAGTEEAVTTAATVCNEAYTTISMVVRGWREQHE